MHLKLDLLHLAHTEYLAVRTACLLLLIVGTSIVQEHYRQGYAPADLAVLHRDSVQAKLKWYGQLEARTGDQTLDICVSEGCWLACCSVLACFAGLDSGTAGFGWTCSCAGWSVPALDRPDPIPAMWGLALSSSRCDSDES